jgi:hypothetical protein
MTEAMHTCFNIDDYAGRERRVFSSPPLGAEIYLSKAPKDIMTVEPILKINTNLHVVCMIRDPRDVITSTHGKNPDRYWAGLGFWKTYTRFWRRICAHPRFISIKYEEFTSHPNDTQRRLMEAIPFLESEAPFSKYHQVAAPSQSSREALGSVRPIRPRSVGRWRNHRSRVAGQLKLHEPITDDLIEFGYEEDDSWRQVLEGVEPDMSPSHKPEDFTQLEIRVRRATGYLGALVVLARRLGIEPLRLVEWIPSHWIPSRI